MTVQDVSFGRLHVGTLDNPPREISVPISIIWPGFIGNSIIYALVLWPLLAVPIAIKRWRRVRHGLCAQCAYPVGTIQYCTECGAAVKPRVADATNAGATTA